ncbi:MAG: tetratricopeptide repeat protein [Desulfovibrionaceae bacterium]
MDLSSNEKYAPLLLQIGFSILDIGLIRDASTLFYAARIAWPKRLGPIIGQVMTCLYMGMTDMAIHMLETEARVEHPNDPAVDAFLGLAYFHKGDTVKAQTVLNSMQDKKYTNTGTTENPIIQDDSVFFMAENLLSELQSDVQKTSPQ